MTPKHLCPAVFLQTEETHTACLNVYFTQSHLGTQVANNSRSSDKGIFLALVLPDALAGPQEPADVQPQVSERLSYRDTVRCKGKIQ